MAKGNERKGWPDGLSGGKFPPSDKLLANARGMHWKDQLGEMSEDLARQAEEVEKRLKALKAKDENAARLVAKSINTLATLERRLISDVDPDQEAYFSELDIKGLPAERDDTPDTLLRRAAAICRSHHFTATDVSAVIVYRKENIAPSLNLGSMRKLRAEAAVADLSREIVECYK